MMPSQAGVRVASGGSAVGPSPAIVVRRITRRYRSASHGRPRCEHAAVVPHDEIRLAPVVLVHGLRARRAREQIVEQAPRLLERHALDVPGVGADIDVLAAVHRVGAHEALAHGRQLALVLGVEQAPAIVLRE